MVCPRPGSHGRFATRPSNLHVENTATDRSATRRVSLTGFLPLSRLGDMCFDGPWSLLLEPPHRDHFISDAPRYAANTARVSRPWQLRGGWHASTCRRKSTAIVVGVPVCVSVSGVSGGPGRRPEGRQHDCCTQEERARPCCRPPTPRTPPSRCNPLLRSSAQRVNEHGGKKGATSFSAVPTAAGTAMQGPQRRGSKNSRS